MPDSIATLGTTVSTSPAVIPVPSDTILIPTPVRGLGLRGYLGTFFTAFADSLVGFVSSAEFLKVEQAALAMATIPGSIALIAVAYSPNFAELVGPCFAPLVYAGAAWLANHYGVRAKLGDNTDSAGNRVPAAVVTRGKDGVYAAAPQLGAVVHNPPILIETAQG